MLPKFRIGDRVRVVGKKARHMYRQDCGVVTKIESIFRTKGPSGALDTIESSIPHIQIPYEFDGKILKVHYPESRVGNWTEHAHTEISTFHGYGITVRLDGLDHLVLYSEKSLKKV